MENLFQKAIFMRWLLEKMNKMFLALLWLAWRRGENLPETEPYSKGVLKHVHIFKPEDFMDKK